MHNVWVDTENDQQLLDEVRTMSFVPLPEDEWLLAIDIRLTAKETPVTFGDTPFGPLGVRMAKTIGVHDGGGQSVTAKSKSTKRKSSPAGSLGRLFRAISRAPGRDYPLRSQGQSDVSQSVSCPQRRLDGATMSYEKR